MNDGSCFIVVCAEELMRKRQLQLSAATSTSNCSSPNKLTWDVNTPNSESCQLHHEDNNESNSNGEGRALELEDVDTIEMGNPKQKLLFLHFLGLRPKPSGTSKLFVLSTLCALCIIHNDIQNYTTNYLIVVNLTFKYHIHIHFSCSHAPLRVS